MAEGPVDKLLERLTCDSRVDLPIYEAKAIGVHRVVVDLTRAWSDRRRQAPEQGTWIEGPYPTDCVRAGSVRLIMRCDAGGQLPAFRRSSNNTANWLSASFQVLAGMIHFFSIFRNAR